MKEIPSQEVLQKAGGDELAEIIAYYAEADEAEQEKLFAGADRQRQIYFGRKVFFRGLIEFSNYCRNDCYYCGIRRSNAKVRRYRLTEEEILSCCAQGHALGFRTFVLQSGEDAHYTDAVICRLIEEIRKKYPDSALTLSLGEKPKKSYQSYFEAGADRYLLRHESADARHYARLHPENLTLAQRKECLYALREIGFQVGAGFMVGSPYQNYGHLAEDLLFLREFQPHMVGVGPFIPHCDTIFAGEKMPDARLTLVLLALVRLILPQVLLPSTTALGTVDPMGREKGLKAGGNVVMPNLSPLEHRKEYALYNDKICTGEEAAEGLAALKKRIIAAGFEPDFSRGDHPLFSGS